LERIIRSLVPTALLVAGAVVFVLGTGFLLASDATLASATPGATGDLAQAGRWLQFVAWACLLGAVCTAGWEAIVHSAWAVGAEIAAAALGTLPPSACSSWPSGTASARRPAARARVSPLACSRRSG
jgi:hypothetical protein